MSDKDKEKEKEKEKTESKPGDLGLLEEDDEFEEFPAEGENLLVNSIKFKIIMFHCTKSRFAKMSGINRLPIKNEYEARVPNAK